MTEHKKATGLTGRIPVALLVMMAGVLLVTAGCANTNNRDNDSRGASLLILDSLYGQAPDESGSFGSAAPELYSDVFTCDNDHETCAIWNDLGVPSFRNEVLNPTDPTVGNGGTSSYFQDIQMYRVRVVYSRADGLNREGIDVPYSFDSTMMDTVPIGGSLQTSFTIVRQTAKMERPLIDLFGGLGAGEVINTNARCDFWGRDIAGNDHHVYGFIPINFADWGP